MKFRRLFKKAAAALMAAVTALSVLPATTAFAAGDIGTISFTHTYDSSGNTMRYNSSAVFDGYTAGGTGKYKYRMFVDGENAFCIQPGVPLKTGNTLKKASSDTWNALSTNQKKAVGLALLYGYQGNRSHLSGSDDEKWLATQTLVWEFVTGCREATGSYQQNSTKAYSLHFGSNYPNSGAKAAYDQIVSLLSEHNTIPSFMSGGKNDITKELAYKDGKYSITLTDKNGVLSDYSFSSSDGNVSVSKSGNKLTISSAVAVSGSVRITAKRNGVPTVSDSAKMIAYGDPNLQDLVTGVENADTVAAYLNIETPTGTIALKKTSEDGVVGGIQFNIKGDNFNKTVTTDKDGNITVEGLFPATYTITEQSIDRYEPQKSQTVTLIGGKTTTVNFNNTLKRGSLEVIKNSEDNLVEGVKFHLYGTSLSGLPVDEYAVTDAKGVAKFSDVLISGDTPYVVEEVDTAIRYVVPASQTAPIEWEKVTSRTFVNVLKKFNVTVTKSDVETGTEQGDASLAGAVYGIYKGEELIDTYTTDGNGQFTSKYYICGDDWTVRELTPSEGYLLDPTIHKVGAEPELYTVEYNSTANDVTEQVIKGNIAIIKHTDDGETQIETPEVGATFEVYLKSAGSFENAKETERDVLTCDENGFAQTKDMPYGIYTVHQTSGWDGRELMKDFDVFISADGQTYRFLINNANFESYIKIVKKDAETGNTIPYAGAGFQIYDPNGNLVTMTFTYPEVTTIDTFYTTADGDLITPQTLEYGTGYSLVEVQAPYGYVLNSEPVYFDVAQDNSTEESGITVIEVVRSNMAQKGTITVSKSGEVFSSVFENNGLYQPISAVSGLEGAVYEITAAEDIYTLDGTLRASKGEVVDTITTGADGTAKSKELYLGKYEVKEITAPFGMVLNDEIHSVETKEKFKANMAAVNLLHDLEIENRLATPEEQKILAGYVGWGGLSMAFDENNAAWANEFKELYVTLSPEEYRAAKESTLTAFYTPPIVIKAMYEALDRLGFSEGNILEPSCGTGNFFGLLPDSMEKSKLHGVEIDSLTGRIAKQLYQKANIAIEGFEKTKLPDDYFDVVLGNVPFGDFRVNDSRYNAQNFRIHDYFFAKALDKARAGGVVMFITSNGTKQGTEFCTLQYPICMFAEVEKKRFNIRR